MTMIERAARAIDRSDAADARRMRWIFAGNGYFMEEQMLCGYGAGDEAADYARECIDEAMQRDAALTEKGEVE